MDEHEAIRGAKGDEYEALIRLRKARLAREFAQSEWIAAIGNARAAGCSLRRIAAVAGVSNPRIHQILTDAPEIPDADR